jgi:catechol 2,3-dioxygenase-like lactoylglutathione lyase family enzyme
MRLNVFTLFVSDQDEALRYFVDKVGFEVVEDNRMGDMRWLLVSTPETSNVAIYLAPAKTPDQRALVGKQGGGAPLFALGTDDCRRDYQVMKSRGVTFEGEPQTMPFGTGVTFQDLYGNRLYLNQEPS